MNILIIANSSVGLVKFRKELIIKILERHKVFIATKIDECENELRSIGAEVCELQMERRSIRLKKEWKLIKQIQSEVKRIRPDLIITYTIKPNIYGGIIARKNKIPYVVNITGLGTAFQSEELFKWIIIHLYRIALKKARVVFFENRENKRKLIQEKIICEEQGTVLNGAGVNLESFAYKAYPSITNRNYLYMGRVMKEKGVDELFSAIQRLHAVYPDVKLMILGEYEEDYEEKVKAMVNKGIAIYIGWVNDVRAYVENSICTVLPSYHEGMSNTLLESAAMGRPVITSDISGCREALVDGISGLLVQVKDEDDLYAKMKQFYELPYNEKVEMSVEARKFIEKNFDKNKVIQDTLNKIGLL